jgi:peptide-methionine (R)-S-oxide reductase
VFFSFNPLRLAKTPPYSKRKSKKHFQVHQGYIPMRSLIILLASAATWTSCQAQSPSTSMENSLPVQKSEEAWLQELGPERYRILRQKGTEYPGTGEYDKHFESGTYLCAGCGTPLFSSDGKFDAHCGWPSFDQEISEGIVAEKRDLSHGMIRTEILCSQCGGHLGHVFDDGPTATGLRYCVNSLSLTFEQDSTEEASAAGSTPTNK